MPQTSVPVPVVSQSGGKKEAPQTAAPRTGEGSAVTSE